MKQFKLFIVLLIFGLTTTAAAQIPEQPNPPRLVNDLAGIFTSEEQMQLEQFLVEFNDSTSNQILIVTVKDLGGLDKTDFAYQIGHAWKVGQAKLNNGLVILIKPKNETKGEVMIATGYGLEGSLPDAVCKRIVENEMIPYFRENNYFGGVVKALSVIVPVAKGEYKYAVKKKKSKGNALGGLVALIVVFSIFMLISRRGRKNGSFNSHGGSGSDLMTMIFLSSLFGRSNHGGSWGGFSGGGGSDSFGGFGGGDFGGGGAGGSW